MLELLAEDGFAFYDDDEDELWACGPAGLVRELLGRGLKRG